MRQYLIDDLKLRQITFLKMRKNYFHNFKEKFIIKKLDSKQPIGIWIFVFILNIIAFIGYYVFNFYGINLTN